jgi:hypothetical protein
MKMLMMIFVLCAGLLALENAMAADEATCQALDEKLEQAWDRADQVCERNAKSKECVAAQKEIDKAEEAFVKAGCDEGGPDDGGGEDDGEDRDEN